jgi:hypothetical protein
MVGLGSDLKLFKHPLIGEGEFSCHPNCGAEEYSEFWFLLSESF